MLKLRDVVCNINTKIHNIYHLDEQEHQYLPLAVCLYFSQIHKKVFVFTQKSKCSLFSLQGET